MIIESSKEDDIVSVKALAEEQSYPRYGYTTADFYENAEVWLADKLEEIESDYKDEFGYVLDHIKDWIAEGLGTEEIT